MVRSMAKKAVLKLFPFERMYIEAYGIMPDRHIDRLMKSGMSLDEANAFVNKRLDDLWQKMKYDHEHEAEHIQQELAKECPF